jgi:hypothetical protein
MVTVLIGLFLIAHGLIHLLYFVTAPDPGYPMTAAKSWLVTRADVSLSVVRALVYALSALALIGFILTALSYWELLVPGAWFQTLAVGSSVCSLLVVAITWHKEFVIGAAINVGIIYWALVWETG